MEGLSVVEDLTDFVVKPLNAGFLPPHPLQVVVADERGRDEDGGQHGRCGDDSDAVATDELANTVAQCGGDGRDGMMIEIPLQVVGEVAGSGVSVHPVRREGTQRDPVQIG